MKQMTGELKGQMAESRKLDEEIKKSLAKIGFKI